ncbi:GNAT family N-acetyltransferase [Peteryoungia ipomoeae]|uniref:N-acetyltransferase n=1 Tax=Peteryoungia ipomoeae TaxID=1210932 RepID=A0A4S8NYW8_9HYPH|nr:N-acetyltransferase [Peteryoungia ipomoeae]THV22913.1 N-acetyltransferase [Peteryoungia ipomoeae]
MTEDIVALTALYAASFPDEDLMPLVAALVGRHDVLSLSVTRDGRLAGHCLFTQAKLQGKTETLALLGPLAVHPDDQRQGIGLNLIADGLSQLTARGIAQVLVLGDPAYYSKSGFHPAARVTPPFPLPAQWREAWQWQRLDGATQDLTGQLLLPQPWLNEALWR